MAQLELAIDSDPEWLVSCPRCGYTDDLQCFDCAGADGTNIFCNACHAEFDRATRAVVLRGKEAKGG